MDIFRWILKVLFGFYFCQKPGALNPVSTLTIKGLTGFCRFGRWPKIQVNRFSGGR